MKSDKLNLIIGFIIIVVNTLWTVHYSYFLFSYHFRKHILWLVMYPNWILITNILIGIIGIALGVLLIRNKLKLKTCLLIEIPMIILGILFEII